MKQGKTKHMQIFGTDAFDSATDKQLKYNDNEIDEQAKRTQLVSQGRFPVMNDQHVLLAGVSITRTLAKCIN